MTALPSGSGWFARVEPAHVAEVGPAAAIVYARILWRWETEGPWRASRAAIVAETGLGVDAVRTAVKVLREHEWVTGERASSLDATLVWCPVLPGHADMGQLPTSDGELAPTPPGQLPISSYERTKKTSRPLSAVPDPVPPAAPTVEVRPEVMALCVHLADRIEGNGSKRPPITKGWTDAARRLLDLDHREVAKVHKAIDWCQDDEFWRANILSMPTLRKQYDKLRLSAQRNRAAAPTAAAHVRDERPADAAYLDTLPPPRTSPW